METGVELPPERELEQLKLATSHLLNDIVRLTFKRQIHDTDAHRMDTIDRLYDFMSAYDIHIVLQLDHYSDCTHCESFICTDHAFCPHCGESNEYWKEFSPADVIDWGEPEANKCGGCNSWYYSDMMFCPYCGGSNEDADVESPVEGDTNNGI